LSRHPTTQPTTQPPTQTGLIFHPNNPNQQVLLYGALAENQPQAFTPYIPRVFKVLFSVIWDPKLELREAREVI
jgi:hypothetical protein